MPSPRRVCNHCIACGHDEQSNIRLSSSPLQQGRWQHRYSLAARVYEDLTSEGGHPSEQGLFRCELHIPLGRAQCVRSPLLERSLLCSSLWSLGPSLTSVPSPPPPLAIRWAEEWTGKAKEHALLVKAVGTTVRTMLADQDEITFTDLITKLKADDAERAAWYTNEFMISLLKEVEATQSFFGADDPDDPEVISKM